MPRMKLCSCGKVIPDTETCSCKLRNERKRSADKNKLQDGFYYSKRWRRFREKILKRDNEVCIRCLIKYNVVVKEGLEAHHIKSRLNYPELSFDETNVLTVCKQCNTQLGTSDKLDFEYEMPEQNNFVL